eukprot:NODE_200_length_15202_cov_0.356618.p4 type:complete len:262 gc:universal NODE_200_length_15202_cov_0.356618:3650-4435(+)
MSHMLYLLHFSDPLLPQYYPQMKPIVAFGHERPVTRLAINRDGDLVVSGSKDSTIALWNLNTLECYGTMQHQGAILDVDIFNVTIVSASADFTLCIWYNGEMKKSLSCNQIVRSCQFSRSGQRILVLLEKYAKHDNKVLLIDRDCEIKQSQTLTSEHDKATICRWGPLNESVLVGFEDGTILVLDKDFKELKKIKDNDRNITDIQLSVDQSMFITSSKDHTARLYDFEFNPLRVYKSDRPVNSASISSKKEHVILGGGQEA